MGMVKKLLCPGVQHGEHTDGAANEAWITGDVDDRLGRGLHQQGITVTLVGAQNGAQFLGHGDGDMEVMAGNDLRLASFNPLLGRVSMALGTRSAAARVIRKDLVLTMIAVPDRSAEHRRATGKNVGDGATMRWRHRRAMGRQVAVRETAEDISDLDHRR